MTPRFSLVYPTRHRPDFVAQALSFAGLQGAGSDFEVIVCDNWIDESLSSEQVCRQSGIANLRYVRPPEPLGMVDNWNYAAKFATGDYVCLFTDKIFMLPNALGRISRAIDAAGEPEIVSWVTDAYQPSSYPDYFGAGIYTAVQADQASNGFVEPYCPKDALSCKSIGDVSRYEQTPSQYCRGKIVFGAYHRSLISRIVEKYGQLFFDISPDYTSMVLALAEAKSACELSSSAVVSIATDISNGVLTSTNDALSLKYLKLLSGDINAMFANMLVPGLYASQANVVSHDYLVLRNRFNLDFALNEKNWLVYCIEDLSRTDRTWSSPEVEQRQMSLMYEFVGKLAPDVQSAVVERLERRVVERNSGQLGLTPPGQRLSWQTSSLGAGIRRRSAWG